MSKKIMVVEDDASLREIYSIRITAEGYEVVSAGDGEEGLAMTVREKPDLILADVMMPKISGFDMLDIIRSTPEVSHTHVVMMTALSAEDQRQRGERLGADRYLVKSQVGIEDVINTIHEVLGDRPSANQPEQPQPDQYQPQPVQSEQPQPISEPAQGPIPQPTYTQPDPAYFTRPDFTQNTQPDYAIANATQSTPVQSQQPVAPQPVQPTYPAQPTYPTQPTQESQNGTVPPVYPAQ